MTMPRANRSRSTDTSIGTTEYGRRAKSSHDDCSAPRGLRERLLLRACDGRYTPCVRGNLSEIAPNHQDRNEPRVEASPGVASGSGAGASRAGPIAAGGLLSRIAGLIPDSS